MAFNKGNASTEASENIKRYWGVAPVKILAVNPSKAELETIFGHPIEKDPVYTGIREDSQVHYARIEFVVKVEEKDVNFISKINFFIDKTLYGNKDKTKCQIIDKYGDTAWATIEEVKNKAIPQYANGPAAIDADYHAVCKGEAELTNFIRTYLCLESSRVWDSNTFTWVTNPKREEGCLDRVKDYFDGDFSELKEVIKMVPDNKVKVLFGVRTTDDNKQYQDVYNRMFLRNNQRKLDYLRDDVAKAKAAGAYSHTEFGPNGNISTIAEYVVTPTEFSAKEEDTDMNLPW